MHYISHYNDKIYANVIQLLFSVMVYKTNLYLPM